MSEQGCTCARGYDADQFDHQRGCGTRMTAPTPPASPAAVKVEQIDRDMLADHLNPLGEPEAPGSWVYSVRNGDEDSYSTLQLLARHRLAALAAPPTPRGEEGEDGPVSLREAAELTLMYLETGFTECDRCGHEIETKTMDAVWQLKEGLSTPRAEIGDDARAREVLERTGAGRKLTAAGRPWYPEADAIAAMLQFAATPDAASVTPDAGEVYRDPAVIRADHDRVIIGWEMRDCRPKLRSEIVAIVGEERMAIFDEMIRDGLIKACFPETRPGDSGRQFWAWAHFTAASHAENAKGVS
jgi:hypothetical protein